MNKKNIFISISRAKVGADGGAKCSTVSGVFNTEEEAMTFANQYFEHEVKHGHLTKPLGTFKDFDELQGDVSFLDMTSRMEYSISTIVVEVPTSYEAYTQSRMRDYSPVGVPSKEEAFAKTFLSELNHQPFSGRKFAEVLCNEHPTIQQMFFRLVRDCIKERATATAYSNDERNEGSVKMCRALAQEVDKFPLPIK